ncbi:thymidine kinase [Paenibacillus albiflavus]|uniref:Thymidine kinase n=1 Tax=Paenibacillus albiflavus TaxID=2545760 RepID=A0A4R4EEC7_9BACL|nr:thymidine kinase [Paenibacillus albiflavus]TCZ76375.1 thymidine kinase [Paenibacillus albiflavus]
MAKLYFRYGTMNSGKSIEVLRTAHNYEEQGKKVLLLTPSIDDRSGVGIIASRIGMQKNAVIVEEEADLFAIAHEERPNCMIIDEAQFLKKHHIWQLVAIVDELNIPVIAYGLRGDFRGELFEGSYHLFALADKIEEIKTICWYCDHKATMNMRLQDGKPVFEGQQIYIAGNESYLPVCRRCYSTKKKETAN